MAAAMTYTHCRPYPPPAHAVRKRNPRYVLEVHRRVQAGMAQLRANDVGRNAFHRQLGSTGVAQAMGMDTLLNAACMRESRQERADRAGLQGVTPARPAHTTARLVRIADSRERNDSSAVHYTPFSCVLLHCCGCSHD